jgi:hypothetical protein
MFLRSATWKRISGLFDDDEQADLVAAMAGESNDPPGIHLIATAMPRPLIEKLRSAMARVDAGA